MSRNRIYWLDVLKALAIFTVYLGHLNLAAGPFYLFVYKYHVPLFFFVSGCLESLNSETSILKNI